MTDRPIIFSAPMVRALLDGRKTMTRRLAWHGGPKDEGGVAKIAECRASPWLKARPGDRLWVREAWQRIHVPHAGAEWIVFAAADNRTDYGGPWRSPIHMPRRASRLTLVVTATKIERSQDISEEDAEAEGVFRHVAEHSLDKVFRGERGATAIRYFQELWESLHGPGSWDSNPEVVALTFTVHKCNIDRMEHAT